MKILKYGSINRLVNFSIKKYLIDWESKSASKPQKLVKDFLHPYLRNHIVCEEISPPGTRMRFDFIDFTTKVAYEISPASSHDFNPFFHKNRIGFLNSLKRDMKKQEWAERAGFKFIEFNEEDLKQLSHAYVLKKFDVYL